MLFGEGWAVGKEVAPLAARYHHFPLHLNAVSTRDRPAQQEIHVSLWARVLRLDRSIVINEPVRACPYYRPVHQQEPARRYRPKGFVFVGSDAFGFARNPLFHVRGAELVRGNTHHAAHDFPGVGLRTFAQTIRAFTVDKQARPTACRDFAQTGRVPFFGSVGDHDRIRLMMSLMNFSSMFPVSFAMAHSPINSSRFGPL